MWAVIFLAVNLLDHCGYGMITSLPTDEHPFKAKLLHIFTILVWMETSFLPYVVLFISYVRGQNHFQNVLLKIRNISVIHVYFFIRPILALDIPLLEEYLCLTSGHHFLPHPLPKSMECCSID